MRTHSLRLNQLNRRAPLPSSPHILRRAPLLYLGCLQSPAEEEICAECWSASPIQVHIKPLFFYVSATVLRKIIFCTDTARAVPLSWSKNEHLTLESSKHSCRKGLIKSPSWARAPWAPASPRTWPMPVFPPTFWTSFHPMLMVRCATASPPPDLRLRSRRSLPPSSSRHWPGWSPSATSKTT